MALRVVQWATGGVGVAAIKGVDPNEIEELWPALTPPYLDLFAWLDG